MTPLSQTILDQYQVRKSQKQKSAFISLLQQHFPHLKIQEGGFPKCRNIIVGDVENAKVILTAHYDTCAQLPLPNFIMPKNPLVSIIYGVLLAVPLLLAALFAGFFLGLLAMNWWIQYWGSVAVYLGLMLLMIAGPANKHTANDNTSGIVVLCELLTTLSPELKKKTAFVFFDHEETGLLGSAYFHSKYKKQMKDKLLINIDCVSDGDHILVSASKSARRQFGDLLKESFLPTAEKSILFTNAETTYYPSDQIGYKTAVAVAALNHKKFLGFYMNRIHTSKDTVFDRSNIALVCNSILQLLKHI